MALMGEEVYVPEEIDATNLMGNLHPTLLSAS